MTFLRGNGNTNLATGNGNRINLPPAIFQEQFMRHAIPLKFANIYVVLAATALPSAAQQATSKAEPPGRGRGPLIPHARATPNQNGARGGQPSSVHLPN